LSDPVSLMLPAAFSAGSISLQIISRYKPFPASWQLSLI
jgi:hypothetical protein